MRFLLLVVIGCSACGGSSTAPSAPVAVLVPQGSLIVQGCTPTNDLYTCQTYTGTLINQATGCAQNLRGVVSTYLTGTETRIGTSEWSYPHQVRANETVVYTGENLIVHAPLTGGWFYRTTVTWDAIRCP